MRLLSRRSLEVVTDSLALSVLANRAIVSYGKTTSIWLSHQAADRKFPLDPLRGCVEGRLQIIDLQEHDTAAASCAADNHGEGARR
jgi:hypothetical protein